MSFDTQAGNAQVVVVTPNFLEAEDLIEEVTRLGLTPLQHVINTKLAVEHLCQRQDSPRLLIMSEDEDGTSFEWVMDHAERQNIGVILINGRSRASPTGRVVTLARPFASHEIQDALRVVLR